MLTEKLKKWLANQKPTRALLLPKLEQLHALLLKYEDQERAQLCAELMEKLENREYVIAFYGHFSAGKSSMINELMGESLLPSSPIPTSANIVKVKEGEPCANILFKDGTLKNFPYPYNIEDIQAYCVNGNIVEEVEISHRTGQLPEGVTVFDTPGIDSTDDAHRVSALSKLHLADLVFYMMDYNHVQSPVNFEFNRQLSERGKDNYIIINQIDKHVASELSFEEFSSRIHHSFTEHHLTYNGLYFTSLQDESHPYNQINELKTFLSSKIADRYQQITAHVLQEAIIIAMDFFQKQQEKKRRKLDEYDELLVGTASSQQLQEELFKFTDRKEAIEKRDHLFIPLFDQILTGVFHNAKLMDYYARIFVRQFLESRELSFQVRGFFSRKKTKKEREARLQQLFQALNENRLSYIDIPLKEELIKLLQSFDVLTEELREGIRQCQVHFSPELLVKLVKSGAMLTDDYVLNYAKDISREMKSLYRQAFAVLVEPLETQAKENNRRKRALLAQEYEEIQQKIDAWKKREQIKAQEAQLYESIFAMLAVRGTEKVEKRPFQAFKKTGQLAEQRRKRFIDIGEAAREWSRRLEELAFTPVDLEKQVKEIKRKASLLAQAGHMEQRIGQLKARIERLEKNEYTIALFGAFSAGKSSFANALLGKRVLPVSPNPTTAAINEIRVPDQDHPHGTVTLLFKTEEQLLKDINQALELSGKTVNSLEALHSLLQEHEEFMKSKESSQEKEKRGEPEEERFSPLEALPLEQFSFLRAALSGYPKIKSQLGQSARKTAEDYTEFVSVEEKACFIERITLYYSSRLTEQGMVLVDTPGAGSMNARHTEMAFNYITSADSIVFVTYYNHAFSRADQAFLTQLGRVKDFTGKDNLFFIVNAADLATAKRDLLDVLQHVEENLIKCGIRQARIYPVSSHLALLAKGKAAHSLTEEEQKRYNALLRLAAGEQLAAEAALDLSGFSLFEHHFYPFTKQALAIAVLQQAEVDVEQAVIELKRRIRLAEADETAKREHRKELSQQLTETLSYLDNRSFSAELEAFQQEIKELLFYAKQRLFYRYNDEFKVIFSPTAFDAFDDTLTALHRMTNEVIRFVAREMTQEMRTAAFRLQTFMQKSMERMSKSLEKELKPILPAIYLKETSVGEAPELFFEAGLYDIHSGLFSSLLKEYKSSLQFFAEGGNKRIRDEIEKELITPVHQYIRNEEERVEAAFLPFYEELLKQTKKDARSQIKEQVEGRLAALTEKAEAAHYKKLLYELQSGYFS
ncbi:hypothetical protein AC623_09720 [Bacillus sp. FJAT-27231]|uniref:dynamin family protein n=1 Tax=Bacillus sp. FJAT-27231 TaxID=1679168 RepID=UPI00067091AB|nr:dynamin family protein [Bacillus sp. FJAT-27231]KMY54176.1 hypothetical protein AC623_09720 [Bacillus sp. FJAT-27231]